MEPARPLRDVFADLADQADQAAGHADTGSAPPDLRAALAGYGDLPDDLLVTAIGSYAGTAPAEVAEHLAPFLAEPAADPVAGLNLLASAPVPAGESEVELPGTEPDGFAPDDLDPDDLDPDDLDRADSLDDDSGPVADIRHDVVDLIDDQPDDAAADPGLDDPDHDAVPVDQPGDTFEPFADHYETGEHLTDTHLVEVDDDADDPHHLSDPGDLDGFDG